MIKIKLCGLSREEDIAEVNRLMPDYIGFVFAKKSRRYVSPERAKELKELLTGDIKAVGVFVNESIDNVCSLYESGIIDIAQLHGSEDDAYIDELRKCCAVPVIKAFKIKEKDDLLTAENSTADMILLDSGAGTGTVLDWDMLEGMKRPYFLAGGLSPDNVSEAIGKLHPFGVDVSSGIETDGAKDKEKMSAFVAAARSVSND